MELDCRKIIKLEDGCSCVRIKGMFFDLLAPDGSLLVHCTNDAKIFRCPVFIDSRGRELARIRFKWSTPILVLSDNVGDGRNREIEMKLFGNSGSKFLPLAEINLFGTKIISRNGHLSVDDEGLSADKQNLIKAILCFCKNYQSEQEKAQNVWLYFLLLLIIMRVASY